MSQDTISINNQLLDLDSLITKIEDNEFLVVAADEELLAKLPAGNWIGGSIPYFMSNEGGVITRDKIFVQTISGLSAANPARISMYDANSISRIAVDAPQHGFTITVLPAESDVHVSYAQNAPEFENMYFTPIIGWVSGKHLVEDEDRTAKTGYGPGNMLLSDKAVAMHVPLSPKQMANVNAVNLFEQGEGPEIIFPETGFSAGKCTIDGVESNIADYVSENNIDVRLPLVANYSGVNVNVSIRDANNGEDATVFYAPVFEGVKYQFAKPITDYVNEFGQAMSEGDAKQTAISYNCLLNFLYSELEGKKTGSITGPVTFGEIAYQLFNQTLVYMTLTQD